MRVKERVGEWVRQRGIEGTWKENEREGVTRYGEGEENRQRNQKERASVRVSERERGETRRTKRAGWREGVRGCRGAREKRSLTRRVRRKGIYV